MRKLLFWASIITWSTGLNIILFKVSVPGPFDFNNVSALCLLALYNYLFTSCWFKMEKKDESV